MRLQKIIMPGVFLLGALFSFLFGSLLSAMWLLGLALGYIAYWSLDVLVWSESERRRIAYQAEIFKKEILPTIKTIFGDTAGVLLGVKLGDIFSQGLGSEPTPGCECDRCKALRAKKTGGDKKRW